jgi:hypothetical protein
MGIPTKIITLCRSEIWNKNPVPETFSTLAKIVIRRGNLVSYFLVS